VIHQKYLPILVNNELDKFCADLRGQVGQRFGHFGEPPSIRSYGSVSATSACIPIQDSSGGMLGALLREFNFRVASLGL
jgi:hypothetical protein